MPAGVEIAIGGGNPLSHPDFDDFVVTLSENGTICNVTINEKHWVYCFFTFL
jgi:organic radical activating enzyme